MLFSRHPIMFTTGLMLLVFSGTLFPHAQAHAQKKYKVVSFSPAAKELPKNTQKRNELKQLKNRIIIGTEPFAANKTSLKTWYVGYTFPMMTRAQRGKSTQADTVKNLETARLELLRDIREVKDAEYRRWLVQQVVKYMPSIAKGGYHPIARYNAMLTIANLNAKEATSVGSNRQPPEPLSAALPILQEALASDTQIDAVRVAAMVGILRHVTLDPFRSEPFGDDDKQQFVNDILPIVQANEPPNLRDPGVHYWLRRRGIEILARLQASDEGGKIADALGTIVTDEKVRPSLRIAASDAIGQTQHLPSSFAGKPTGLAVSISQLAAEASRETIEQLDEIALAAERNLGTGRGFGAGGLNPEMAEFGPAGIGAASPFGDPSRSKNGNLRKRQEVRKADWEKELELSRRSLLTTLASVDRGLRGPDQNHGILSLAENEPHTANITRLSQVISDLAKTCDAEYEEIEDLIEDLRQNTDRLDTEIAQMQESAENIAAVVAADNQPVVADNDDNVDETTENEPVNFDDFQ